MLQPRVALRIPVVVGCSSRLVVSLMGCLFAPAVVVVQPLVVLLVFVVVVERATGALPPWQLVPEQLVIRQLVPEQLVIQIALVSDLVLVLVLVQLEGLVVPSLVVYEWFVVVVGPF